MRRNRARRLTVLAASLALVAGVSVVLATDANASVTSPGNGATVHGVITLTASPGGTESYYCHGSTDLWFEKSSGTVLKHWSNDGGKLSKSLTTEDYPNGTYYVKSEKKDGSRKWYGACYTKHDYKYTNTIHIDNKASLSYTGDTSGAFGSTATLTAKLTDRYNSSIKMSGQHVTFRLGSQSSVTVTTNSSGVATAHVPITTAPGSTSVYVSFAKTSYYDATSTSKTFTVNRPASHTTISAGASTVHGQPYSFSASVTKISGLSTPTGTIQFSIDGHNFGSPVALSSGHATSPSTSTLSTGNHTLGATYSGNSQYLGSTAASATHTVGKAATKTALVSSPSATVYGQQVTFTATVSVSSPGVGSPSGAVQFDVDGDPYGTAVPLNGNAAKVSISTLGAGNHSITATYNGDGDFAGSTSAALTQGVDRAATSSVVTSATPSSVSGQSVTFSTTVTAVAPGAGTPTGKVQFSVDGTALGAPVALNNGKASSPAIATLPPGSYTITADYQGDANFAGSSDQTTQTVQQAQTSTSLTSSASTSVFGQAVTFTATVGVDAPGAGTPSGTVQFLIDGTAVGNPVALYEGKATSAPVSDLQPGTYTVTARYSGDTRFSGSTSDALSQHVNKADTSTDLQTSGVSVFGESVTFTATVSVDAPGAGGPTGTVTFTDGSTVIGTTDVSPDTGEHASVSTSALSVGSHAITATYSGDGDFESSQGLTTQVVHRAQTSVVVSSSVNPAESGQPVSFTAVVTAVAPGAGVPSGTVTFTVNGNPLGAPAVLTDGTATSSSFATLSPGTYSIEATYNGDASFVTSSADLDEGAGLDVQAAPTTLSLDAGPSPVDYGATVTLTATVTPDPSATGTPTGIVRFFSGDVLLGSSSLAAQGGADVATFAVSGLATGEHGFHAEYVGNFNFTGSQDDASVTVGPAPTLTVLNASPTTAVYGQPVTLTALVSARTGTATGTVTFYDGDTLLGSTSLATVHGSQQASFTATGLDAGTHHVTARYAGTTGITGSTSDPVTVTITRQATGLVARAIIVQGVPGDAELNLGQVQATLTDAAGNPMPGQTLVFSTNQPAPPAWTVPICTGVTDATGTVTCDAGAELSAIDLDHGYDVTFAGTSNYAPASAHGEVVD